MADVFDKETKILFKSVNTPDYLTDRYIINPAFVPQCESKYIVVNLDNNIREMTAEEKAVVDYVEPIPEPTPEELSAQAEDYRDINVIKEISNTYSLTDELQIIREALTVLMPENVDVINWNSVVLAAKEKYVTDGI